jgi:hypothetical protein
MSKLKELEKYLDYEFSSGYYTGQDYKTFERKYINYLKIICKENGWELARVNKNHYEFSAFFKYENKYIYMSISDVRFPNNEWYNRILIRTAKHETDYTGGQNNFCSLPYLISSIQKLIGENYDR